MDSKKIPAPIEVQKPQFEVAVFDEIPPIEHAPRSPNFRRIGKRLAKYALIGGVFVTPIVGGAIHEILDQPPTKVPITIAGSEVTAEVIPGDDTITLEAIGHSARRPSDLKIGRKDIGIYVNFGTSDLSLKNPDGSFDKKSFDSLVKNFSNPSAQQSEIKDALIRDSRHSLLKGGLSALAIELVAGGVFLHSRRFYKNCSDESKQEFQKLVGFGGSIAGITVASLLSGPIYHDLGAYFAQNNP